MLERYQFIRGMTPLSLSLSPPPPPPFFFFSGSSLCKVCRFDILIIDLLKDTLLTLLDQQQDCELHSNSSEKRLCSDKEKDVEDFKKISYLF